MYNLNYLFKKVKKEINYILNETRGRKSKAKPGRKLKDKDAMQTVLMLLLATLKGWSLRKVLKNCYFLSFSCPQNLRT